MVSCGDSRLVGIAGFGQWLMSGLWILSVGVVKSRSELAASLGHRSISGAAIRSIASLLEQGMVECTIPEKPRVVSRNTG